MTGKLDTFAPRARVIHFEIDPAEIGKTRRPDVAVLGDLGLSVARLVELSTQQQVQPRTSAWLARIAEWKQTYPLTVPPTEGPLFPQEVLLAVRELAPNAIVTTDVGQHQMWAAQYLRNWAPGLDQQCRSRHHGLRHAGRNGGPGGLSRSSGGVHRR